MCTINKSAHTKKIWKLIVCTSYNGSAMTWLCLSLDVSKYGASQTPEDGWVIISHLQMRDDHMVILCVNTVPYTYLKIDR